MAVSGKPCKDGFFAVDRRTLALICAKHGLNPAVAYLVLARGTGRDNRTSCWSVQSVERRTSISRGRSKAAIQALVSGGLVLEIRGGTKPKYDLLPWEEIPEADKFGSMTKRQEGILAIVRRKGTARFERADMAVASGLVKRGILFERSLGHYQLAYEQTANEPSLVWLPNALIDGALDECPPIERVRQTQDAMTLRLLVDAYSSQNLAEHGGIGRHIVRKKYERREVGRQAEYVVWGFRRDTLLLSWGSYVTDPHRREYLTATEREEGKNRAVDFFQRLDQLSAIGLVEWVPCLFDADNDTAELIHPVGMAGTATEEDRLGRAAFDAGEALVTHEQLYEALDEGRWIVPVPRHIANVAMIGIARLRYRPHTKMTAAWWADQRDKMNRYIAEYEAISNRASNCQPGQVCNIKDESKGHQRSINVA